MYMCCSRVSTTVHVLQYVTCSAVCMSTTRYKTVVTITLLCINTSF
jgi:hypothetical protein